MKFISLDVETANPDMSSICQVGIVHFEDGKPVETWSSLVDPWDQKGRCVRGTEFQADFYRDKSAFRRTGGRHTHGL